MSDARQEALKAAGLPERLAPLLHGEGEDELEANAIALGQELGITPTGGRTFEANMLAHFALEQAAKTRALLGITEEGDE